MSTPRTTVLSKSIKKTFWAKEVTSGKTKDREKTAHGLENQKTFTIRVEVSPDHVVHRLKTGDTWLTLDSWTEAGRNFSDGKFGFYIPVTTNSVSPTSKFHAEIIVSRS